VRRWGASFFFFLFFVLWELNRVVCAGPVPYAALAHTQSIFAASDDGKEATSHATTLAVNTELNLSLVKVPLSRVHSIDCQSPPQVLRG
jgi:hypothetical protein